MLTQIKFFLKKKSTNLSAKIDEKVCITLTPDTWVFITMYYPN
jgi:hypothetical protein